MKNITLAIDEDLLERSRAYAEKRGTTLNALVRSELSELIRQDQRQEEARQGLLALIDSSTARIGPDFKFDREEIYESPMLSGHKHPDLRRSRKRG
jgi:hypothetical protein